ncbi:DUF7669 domain-containing protein [Aeromicrobium stalagmiti]|uniref:DUF7669 domain-containing protein n=1 Tax=Aeromicrobium stalagmiti TaxID=2738988 RepID=UPI001569D85C|nr:DUF6884 domain-containing protein [Aeromicrobium stalagmiti]NRQ50463.1 hypothetical protein [Aeromicrobium stalagmiti]
MKYDRPVWQIMHQCADAMHEVFRYEDVRNWFADHYPDVNEATIRAHLIGLTEGGRAKHVQFAQRSPVFRRVARGEYEPIPIDERGEDPDGPQPSASRIKMSGNGAHRQTLHEGPAHEPVVGREAATPAADHPAGQESTAEAQRSEPSSEPDEDPEPAASGESDQADEHEQEQHIPDVILLGSVGERVNVPAPAKEVFREVSFQLSRLDAELAGSEWFVLSAEHGLLAPNEWMSPDSRTLADMEPEYRLVWASWVVTRLQSLVGCLEGMFVRVDAPNAFVGPLFAHLQEAGAVVASGDVGATIAPRQAAYVRPDAAAQRRAAESLAAERLSVHAQDDDQGGHEPYDIREETMPDHDAADHDAPDEEELAEVVEIDAGASIAAHLADERHAVPATDLSSLPEAPGVYGWFVDQSGARELNRCLRLPVRAGLVFVGQVGGSSWHSMADPVLTLRGHVERIQLHGRSRASTFRMTLATVLSEHLRMTSVEDPRLTDWMLEHLSVSYWASDDFGDLRDLEQRLVTELDSPLNVDHLPATEYRARLTQMRSALA